MEEDSLFTPPGPEISYDDLHCLVVAQLLEQARTNLRELRTADDYYIPMLSEEQAALLADLLPPWYAYCALLIKQNEDAAERSRQYWEMRRAYEAERRLFLADLHSHITWAGAQEPPASWAVIGWQDDPSTPGARAVAIPRDAGLVALAAGIQGTGKSVFCTNLCEGFLQQQEGLTSDHEEPTACIVFHVEEQDRLPQQLAGLRTNPSSAELEILADRLGIGPEVLPNVHLYIPPDVLPRYEDLLGPYLDLGLKVGPLLVQLGQLGQPALEAALGAESGARYIQRMLDNAQSQGDDLNLRDWHTFIEEAEDLNSVTKRSAHERLRQLSQVASPPGGPGLWDMVGPGVLSILFLGGPHIGLRTVVPLVSGLMNGVVMPSPVHGAFKRVILVDEHNRFDHEPTFWKTVIALARKVRHYALTLGIFGQDLLYVPDEFIGLAALCIIFRLINPKIFDNIRERVGGFNGVRFEEIVNLGVGEAMMAATLCTDPAWQRKARKVFIRMLRCMHGGHTRKVA